MDVVQLLLFIISNYLLISFLLIINNTEIRNILLDVGCGRCRNVLTWLMASLYIKIWMLFYGRSYYIIRL